MIELKCDKCGKEIETALYLKNDRVWEKGTCQKYLYEHKPKLDLTDFARV